MSLTYGFYDSLNHDRVYNAEQFGSIFDGVINDGVYMNIGQRFKVTPKNGLTISVGTGRAWFKHTWTLNTDALPITVETPSSYYDRRDLIVIRVDKRPAYRQNTIEIITGTPSSTPERPDYNNGSNVWDFPIAEIWVPKNATTITAANITILVGKTSRVPYVTSPTGVVDLSVLTDRYEAAWNEFYDTETTEDHAAFTDWLQRHGAEFQSWFDALVDVLGGEDPETQKVAANLEAQILNIQNQVESNNFTMALVDDDGNNIVTDEYDEQTEEHFYICGAFSYVLSGDTVVLQDLVLKGTFTYTGRFFAASAVGITRRMFRADVYNGTPLGYTPVNISRINTGNSWLIPVGYNASAGDDDNMVVIRNLYSGEINATVTIEVVFVKTASIGE